MNRRIHCGWLFLALLSAWAEDLTPVTAWLKDDCLFTADVYPIALRYRSDIQADIELPQSVEISLPAPNAAEFKSPFVLAGLQETFPQVFYASDICYALMSLQW